MRKCNVQCEVCATHSFHYLACFGSESGSANQHLWPKLVVTAGEMRLRVSIEEMAAAKPGDRHHGNGKVLPPPYLPCET